MADAAEMVRPPQSEIYGRSLSTIHRLGAYAVGKETIEVVQSPEAEQARVEFYTSVEEGFGTDRELGGTLEVRDFDFRPIMDGRVMADDLKTPVSDMTEGGLICAEVKFAKESDRSDCRFRPQLIRSRWDHNNALIVDKMARGETDYNTRIVVSPFPEEAAAKSGDAYWRNIGYVPHLRRGFVQFYHSTQEGLIAGSLSFDGSSTERLRELFRKCGVIIPEAEVSDNWLQYAITDTLPQDEAKSLALEIANEAGDPAYKKNTNTVDVTGEHRKLMDIVFNESYVHACESLALGRQAPRTRALIIQLANKAESFGSRHANALYRMRASKNRFTDDDMIVLHEVLVYSTIEMMRTLHIDKAGVSRGGPSGNQASGISEAAYLQALNHDSFQEALSGFAAEGARSNRVYSACGLEIALGEPSRRGESPQSAFGGITSGEDKFGSRRFQCTVGHWNHRPYNKLISKCQHRGCTGKVKC